VKEVTITSTTGKRRVSIPETWEEVTVDQFQRIHASDKGIITIFSILSNMEYDSIYESTDRRLEEALYSTIKFTSTPLSTEVPKMVTFDKVEFKVPDKVGSLSIGQNIHVREKFSTVTSYEEVISTAFCVYLQPLIHKCKFDYDKAMELHDRVLKMPITEIYAIGFFLLKPLVSGGKGFISQWLRIFIHSILNSRRNGRA